MLTRSSHHLAHMGLWPPLREVRCTFWGPQCNHHIVTGTAEMPDTVQCLNWLCLEEKIQANNDNNLAIILRVRLVPIRMTLRGWMMSQQLCPFAVFNRVMMFLRSGKSAVTGSRSALCWSGDVCISAVRLKCLKNSARLDEGLQLILNFVFLRKLLPQTFEFLYKGPSDW